MKMSMKVIKMNKQNNKHKQKSKHQYPLGLNSKIVAEFSVIEVSKLSKWKSNQVLSSNMIKSTYKVISSIITLRTLA